MNLTIEKSITGCLLGTAIGDALGLCCEGLSKKRLKKMYPDMNKYHFFFNKGMISDDTEHTCMVAQAILDANGDPEEFQASLSGKFRFWLLGLPAGIGMATLKAILKLWAGFPPGKSAIFSAGNGPAMRSAIIGVYFADEPGLMHKFVSISTRITHSDPKAEFGALAVALAASLAAKNKQVDPDNYLTELLKILPEGAEEFIVLLRNAIESVKNQQTTEDYVAAMGLEKGITGYIYHTVPPVIHCWLNNQNNYKEGIKQIINCGGDTDTTAAILGGIIGASTGTEGIPEEWLRGLFEWPRSVKWMEELGFKLAKSKDNRVGIISKSLEIPVIGIFLRNIFFMIIVLLHGFRRLLPPY
jgi:ADP-ribosyl-[dinitrogen reductase] hydrolase